MEPETDLSDINYHFLCSLYNMVIFLLFHLFMGHCSVR